MEGRNFLFIYLFISPFWPLEIGKTVTASHQDIKPALSQHKYEKAKTSPKPKNKVKKQKQKTPLCRSPLVPTAFWTSLQDVPGGEPSKAGCLASSHLLQVPSCPTAWHLPLTLFLARLHLKAIKSPSPSVRDKVQMPPKPPAHGWRLRNCFRRKRTTQEEVADASSSRWETPRTDFLETSD